MLLRLKRMDSGIPWAKILGHNAPESAVCRRPIGETVEFVANAVPGKDFPWRSGQR
jgi:hypothetical protein